MPTTKMPERSICSRCGLELYKGDNVQYNDREGYICSEHNGGE